MKRLLPLAVASAATLAVASPAMAAPATVVVKNDSFTPKSVSINTGEAVTWDVQEGGHNIAITSGPESWKSTSGKDPKGTQVVHQFNTAGTYQYICEYHGGMKGTVTVVTAQPSPQPQPQPQPQPSPQPQPKPQPQPQPKPKPGGSGGQPTSGGSTQGGTTAGPAGTTETTDSTSSSPSGTSAAIDPAAPALRATVSRSRTLTVNAGKAGRLIVSARNLRTKRVAKHTYRVRAGRNTVSLKRLITGPRYRLSVVLVDASGNRSAPVRLRFTR